MEQSAHFFNGAFGEKWAFYNEFWDSSSFKIPFSEQVHLSEFIQNSDIDFSNSDTICLVQSETSNGTGQTIRRKDFSKSSNAIIAVDATSSMGGIELPWIEADVWFASVQKCMGLQAERTIQFSWNSNTSALSRTMYLIDSSQGITLNGITDTGNPSAFKTSVSDTLNLFS